MFLWLPGGPCLLLIRRGVLDAIPGLAVFSGRLRAGGKCWVAPVAAS